MIRLLLGQWVRENSWGRNLILFGALLLVLAPAAGGAGSEPSAKFAEVEGMRTATSETLANEKGEYRTRLFANPVYYPDGDEWAAIDTSLVASEKVGYALESKANAFTASFKSTTANGFFQLDLPDKRGSIQVSLVGAKPGTALDKPAGTDDKVTAGAVLPDTDLEYQVLPTGVKESLVLQSAAAPSSITETISSVDGAQLDPKPQPDGSVLVFTPGVAGPLFSIDAPIITDSGPAGKGSTDEQAFVSLATLPNKDGSLDVTVKVDQKWLADPARVFPVTIDPTYSAITDTQDGHYDETAGGTPNMTGTELYLGKNGSGGSTYGTVAVFDLSSSSGVGSIPIGATVTNVYPNLYLTGCLGATCTKGTTTTTVSMYPMLLGWDNTTSWTTSFRGGSPTLMASRAFDVGSGGDAVNSWYQLTPSGTNLVNTVQSIVNGGTSNFGFLFEKTAGNANNGLKFASSRHSDTTKAPYLDVYWTVAGVQLDESPAVHANGADLTWARWYGNNTTYAPAVMADTPALYWRLDESGGTHALDQTTNARTGTYASGVLLNQPGAIAGNASADLSSAGVTQDTGNNINLSGQSFTVEFWARRLSSGTDDAVVSQGAATNNNGLHIGFRSNNQFTCAFFGNDLNTTATYTDALWHHWACTYDASNKQRTIYRDGVQVAQATASANFAGSGVINVGQLAWGGWPFAGNVDEVAIYPTKLAAADIADHASKGLDTIPGFQKYEVHRSTSFGFTPGSTTLVATLTDQAVQNYRDTTAKPDTDFYYKVRTVTAGGSYDSNQMSVHTPVAGKAKVTIQPGFVTTRASGTYIVGGSQAATSDRGGLPTMIVDAQSSTPARALLAFEMRPVPSGVNITDAQLQLYSYQPNANATIDVHGLTTWFSEGAASWNNYGPSKTWINGPGGDKDTTATATITDNSTVPHWDSWQVKDLVQLWVNGTHTQQGFLLKYQAETTTPTTQLQWVGDGYARSIALRPKLVVTYDDPSATVLSPEVAINAPAPSAKVKGSSVVVSAGASDDGTAVSTVQFKLDGANLGTGSHQTGDPSNIFKYTWDSTTASRGTHSLTAVVTDDAGNTTVSDAVSVDVANSAAPTVSASATGGPASYSLSATASDDNAVSNVEFYVDGDFISSDSSSPFAATLNTLTGPPVVYDGSHTITAKAYDADGNVTTSSGTAINVTNTAGTKFMGTFSVPDVPLEMRYDPAAGTQDGAGLTITMQNTSAVTWTSATTKLRRRWLNPDGTEFSNSGSVTIGADLAAGGTRNKSVTVDPPALPDGVMRSRFVLEFDLYDTGCSCTFASKGNKPFRQAVMITKVQSDELGLERYQQYDGTDLGTGFGANVNLANGNLNVTSILSSEPGIGLDTVAELNYNSLEDGSVSPAGNDWSFTVSGLTAFGLPLDIHPNASDTAAGRSAQWIGLVDGDGTYHRFTKNATGNYYDEPAGVNLYVRATGSGDPDKYWAATKPDRTTFYFNQAGYPTRVEDKDGNALVYTLSTVAAGDDAYGLAKQITKVTDQGGRDFTVAYLSRAQTGIPALRGKISKITDHRGHSWLFSYYDDGNLMRVTEQGGRNGDGSYLADRTVTFSYTNPGGTAAAIATLAGRRDPTTSAGVSQSSKLFSAIDARGNETKLAYITAAGATKWRVSTLADRMDTGGTTTHVSTYTYNTGTSTTTVAMPTPAGQAARSWSYVFDSQGRATSIIDPLNATTAVNWTSDNQVQQVTELSSTADARSVSYTYNANGYLLTKTDQVGNVTSLTYDNREADVGNDPGNHISRVTSVVQPEGNYTATAGDYTTSFDYTDTTHDRVHHITDALGNSVTNAYYNTYSLPGGATANGLLQSQTLPLASDAIPRATTYNTYDDNGLSTDVTDAAGSHAFAEYDAAGNLKWEQDPNHGPTTSHTGDQAYSTVYFYDSFGRMGRQSSPRSTSLTPGMLEWDDTSFDPNDNTTLDYNPRFGAGDSLRGSAALPVTTDTYDEMDRQTLEVSPRGSQTATTYDEAGRVVLETDPKGVPTGTAKDYATETLYDPLDREHQAKVYDDTGANPRITSYCYDLAGDLRTITAPLGSAVTCPTVLIPSSYTPTSADYTSRFTYDAAHRQTQVSRYDDTASTWRTESTSYDHNGQVKQTTDANNKNTNYEFDARGLQTKIIQDFNAPTKRIETLTFYDELGRASKTVSPRGVDTVGNDTSAESTYARFVTTYGYDALSQLVRTAQPGSSYSTTVLADSPTVYWRLNDTAGSTSVTDSSGNGNTGTVSATGTTLGVSPGAINSAIDTAATFVSASSGKIETSSNPSTDDSYSIEAWYKKPTSGSVQPVVKISGTSHGGSKVEFQSDGRVNGWSWDNASHTCGFGYTTGTVGDGKWHHAVVTRNNQAMAFYLDGKLAQSTTCAGLGATSGTRTFAVATQGGTNYDGSADDAAFYDTVLTAAQVRAHYEAGISTNDTSYAHQAYDKNGNQTQVSLPTAKAALVDVAAPDLTTTSYLDDGAIYSTLDGSTGLSIRYDFTPEGWQSARLPDQTGAANVIDYTRAMYWRYLPDGLLADVRDMDGQRELYSYDLNSNQTNAAETSGATLASQSLLKIERNFDGFDQLTKTRSPNGTTANSWLATTYTYDANGNTLTLIENRTENDGGTQTAAGRAFAYCYDRLDRIVGQSDDYSTADTPGCTPNTGSGSTSDEKIQWTYTPTGLTATRTLYKGTGAGWTQEHQQINDYWDDSSLKQRTNKDATGTLIEDHQLSYIDNTIYQNGNVASDVFKLKPADGGTTCFSATCTATWAYDTRDRLIREDTGTTGGLTTFTLDITGNATGEPDTTRTYSGQKLVQQTISGTTTKYLYDGLGNVDCIVTGTYNGSTCPAGSTGNLVEDYAYDYKNRLVAYSKWAGTSNTDSASYVYDALDRPVAESETHSGSTTTTGFRYLGDTNAVTRDTLTGTGATTKNYAFGSDGDRITVSEGANRYSYLYDWHGSVSELLKNDNTLKASYGYAAYGKQNAQLSKTASGYADKNPYKYAGSRFDTGSSTYDMGARRYSPSTGRWLQQDLYYDAFDNLGLSQDPLNANRYLFAGANPINYVDVDGHSAEERGKGPVRARKGFEGTTKVSKGLSARIATKQATRAEISQTTRSARYAPKPAEKLNARANPPGENRPRVNGNTEKARTGQAVHKAFSEQVRDKPGWQSQPQNLKDPLTGKKVVPDALTPSGRPIELKPNTPSGRAAGARQLKKYERATGKKGRVVYYG